MVYTRSQSKPKPQLLPEIKTTIHRRRNQPITRKKSTFRIMVVLSENDRDTMSKVDCVSKKGATDLVQVTKGNKSVSCKLPVLSTPKNDATSKVALKKKENDTITVQVLPESNLSTSSEADSANQTINTAVVPSCDCVNTAGCYTANGEKSSLCKRWSKTVELMKSLQLDETLQKWKHGIEARKKENLLKTHTVSSTCANQKPMSKVSYGNWR